MVSPNMDSQPMVLSEMAAYSSTSIDVDIIQSPSASGVESSVSSLDCNKDGPMLVPLKPDPSVVVGMACRVPGATNTSQLWKVLAEQQDLQKKMPEDRFNVDAFYHPQGTNKGTTNARYGYFLDQGLDLFDNEFFRISGKEAESIDPQQRLVLEVVYEALENAGITLAEIRGTQTSVFCGSFTNDYYSMITKDLAQYPKYAVTGLGNAILSNRLSYFYDLHGPSLTIDTACSSSLVCLHLGNKSLQDHESDISIIAGSALHFDPNIFITMTDFEMLSSDGRCRTFDAEGNGYVRGEGVCAMILKRRSRAETDGDKIRSVIRGSGSNHDGSKDGLTLPNEIAQAQLMRDTYKSAGLSTADTDYFEAHGTGTKAGDPREAGAIGKVFAPDRQHPLLVGSIKSNLGHLEGASGLIGVIKATMSIERAKILPNMHFNTPNPAIDFQKLKIKVPTELTDWKTAHGVRRASVNSFGYGGQNAHVILENYRPKPWVMDRDATHAQTANIEERPFLIPLTSHTEKAGKLLGTSISEFIQQKTDFKIHDLAYSMSLKRSMHQFRSFAIGHDQKSILHDLAEPNLTASWSRVLQGRPRIGFIFTGQGAQWYAMGRQLIEHCQLFKQTLERCDATLRGLPDSPDWSCIDELCKSAEDSLLSQSRYSQPVCAALQLGIVELLKAWRVTPSAVVGHSSGEIVAAYCAGVLSFENTMICAYYRGLYMSKGVGRAASTRGAMIAVGLSEIEGKAELRVYEGRISLAAINSPSNLTFSGDEDAILEMKQALEGRKIFVRRLKVEQAFHSHHMQPLAPAFEQALSRAPGFGCHPAKIRFCSSVTARNSWARKMNAEYWALNMTETVMFSDALTGILVDEEDEQNVEVLVEIGAHPALRGPSKEVLTSLKLKVPYLASLTREAPAFESLLATAGQLFSVGFPVDLAAVNSNFDCEVDGRFSQITPGRMLSDLPTYSWDHGKFWSETRQIREQRFRKHRHSLLGFPAPGALEKHPRWRNYLRLSEIPWLPQHVVDDKTIFPAAGYISMAIEALNTLAPRFMNVRLRDVVFKAVLTLSSSDIGTEVITELQPVVTSAKSTSSTWFRFVICSFDERYKCFEHCHGLIGMEQADEVPVRCTDETAEGFVQLQKATNRSRPRQSYYARMQRMGLIYGDSFQLLSGDIESGAGFAIAPLTFRPTKVIATPADACVLHPTCLDAAFHVIFAAIESTQNGRPLDEAFVPTFVRSMTVSGLLNIKKHESDDQTFWVKSETRLPGSRVAVSHLSMQSGHSNHVLVDIQGFEFTALGNGSGLGEPKRSLFFRMRWQPAFDRLGRGTYTCSFGSIADVMDVFAHQFPDARILHLTPNLRRTRELLRLLGGLQDERRRFNQVTPYSLSSDLELMKEDVADWGGLVIFETPNHGDYDVVVISELVDHDVTRYLKTDGFVIADNNEWDPQALPQIFKDGAYSSYRKCASIEVAKQDLTLLVSTNLTATSKAMVSAITDLYKGTVTTLSIIDVAKVPPPSCNIISLVSLDEDAFFEASSSTSMMFDAIQKILRCSGNAILWLLRGATNESPNPAQAMILGLARTVRNENENLKFITLDLPMDYEIVSISRHALGILSSPLSEDEFAVRNGALFIPRVEADDSLNRKLPNGGNRRARLESFKQERNLALKIGKVGLLDTLVFDDDEDVDGSEIGDEDVEIEVKASALNFRDLAASIGIIDDYRLGDECSGIVTRTGRKVNDADFRSGDRVLAIRPGQGAHRSIVRNPALLCHKVGPMDFVTATSFATVFTTAYYSLVDTARLRKEEFCLIHAAAGGVGQMAVQLAQFLGAKVIATVGSQSKRDFLKANFALSDDMILSSRDSSFVDGVLKITKGRGCDVALNSLAGELLHATWSCMAPFGRLVEIGKRDIHENTKLDMDPFRRNTSYASVDLITLFNCNKTLLSRVLDDCYKLVEDGNIQIPNPITELSYAEAQTGFRLLQVGKHIGKIVLVPGDNDLVPVLPSGYRNSDLFKSHKTYLLIGGLGGLGRTLAEWMFRKGARNLAFLSRSGTERTDAKATIEWLKFRSVHVSIFIGDVADPNVVQECVQTFGSNLAGIFQAAMVLRDTLFADMTLDQWQECVRPKVRGSHNLHEATKDKDLDFFICFSSCAAIVGSKGQANYAAANSYLDALMNHRRRLGLAGTTMNVGAVSGIGTVAENNDLQKTMKRTGYELINEDELFYQIEEAVSSHNLLQLKARGFDDHQIITGINTQTKDLHWATRSIFRNLYGNLDLGVSVSGGAGIVSLTVSLLSTTDIQERIQILLAAFIEKVAGVLAVPAETIQAENPLSAYGLDSIVALEFRKWFSNMVAVEVTLFDILGSKSIKALIAKAIGQMTLTCDDVSGHSKMTNTNAPPLEIIGGKLAKTSLVRELKGMRKPNKIPMSTFQRRIWFLHNLLENPSALNFVVTAQFKGHPNLSLLERTFAELYQRNDILRTCYFEGDTFSEQAVLENSRTHVQFIDLAHDAILHLKLRKYIEDARNVPMRIEDGEVMTFALVKMADATYTAVFVCHHIALDNGSTASFMEQFTALYDALMWGKSLSHVAAPKITYSDFTLWYQDKMESGHLKEDMRWWAENLNGSLNVSRLLPFAKVQRPLKRSSARSLIRNTLNLSLLKRLRRICARTNATPFQFLLTAFRAFMYRYTQEEDLTILMVDGNRPHPDLEETLGFFVNMIPLRCRNTCDGAFEGLMGEIQRIVLNALAHDQVSFDVIVEAVRAEVNPSHFPIGQIAFNYQMYGKPPNYKTGNFTIEDISAEDIPTACELQLEALEDPDSGIKLRLEYDSFLYEASDMDRFFENFCTFLTSVVRDHRQSVDEIEMCGSKELDYLRSECWGLDLQRNAWNNQSIIDKTMQMAKKHPGKTAILTSDGQTICYSDLLSEAQKIAFCLRDAGLSPGQFVGIFCYPGIDMVAAMMGAIFASCAYVPLDPKFAKGRLTHMIEDSSVSIILTGEGTYDLAEDFIQYKGHPIQFLSIRSASSVTQILVDYSVTAESPFYVIYTSGSTGKPKGVVLSHSNTQAMLSSHNKVHAFNNQDTILFQSSVSFDLSVAQIWGSLTSGATMALASQEARQDPVKLSRFIRDAAVTVTYFPPTQFALLLEHNIEDLRQCISYRRALFCGESLPIRLVKAIYDLRTPVLVFNEYGPTETTVQTTFHQVPYPGPADLNIPIGRPIANCAHFVVDRQLRPVPASVVGELCIGGAQVSRGYRNRPTVTEEAFVDDPFSSETLIAQGWSKLYRTGDRAYFLPDGQISFQGRISGDKQIKFRGHRIDLAEIENEIHLASQSLERPEPVNVAVLPRDVSDDGSDITDNRQLIAFIVLSRDCTPNEQRLLVNSLHKTISTVLNDVMLPSAYQFMNALPALVSGKIDRQTLLKTDLNPVFPSSATGLGAHTIEGDEGILSSVIESFKEVLKLPHDRELIPTHNFFELGGQSILLLRLRAALKRKFGVDIPLLQLFEHPTPMSIASRVLEYANVDGHEKTGANNTLSEPDWPAEAILPSTSQYDLRLSATTIPRAEFKDILLTGADSFTGIHMLAGLISTFPCANIHVLGSQSKMTPFDIGASFEQWHLFTEKVTPERVKSQIRYVSGTLSLTHFGLDDQSFRELGRSVQSIYHIGGQISLLKTYRDLKRLNVGSTIDVIEMAKHGSHRTEIHYLSTWSVPHLQSWKTSRLDNSTVDITESSPASYQPGGGEELGYFKSRWVAEMLLNEASNRGFPVTIYRSSAVTSSLASNLSTPDDNLTQNMVLSMIEAGSVPDLDTSGPEFAIDFIPIDFLVSVMTHLSSSDAVGAPGNLAYYHIGNPYPLNLRDLPTIMTQIRDDGVQGSVVPLSEWLTATHVAKGGDEETTQLEKTVLKQFLDLGHTMFSLDGTKMREAMHKTGTVAECPAVDEKYLSRLFRDRK